jgi:hypothetical protein
MKLRTRAGLALLTIVSVVAACRVDHPTQPLTKIVELQSIESELYPQREDVAIESLERLPIGVGVNLKLRSDVKDFRYFIYSINGAENQKSESGALAIPFEDNHKPEAQKAALRIHAVDALGKTSKDYELIIGYFPKELYEKSGQTARGYVIVQKSDIPFVSSRVEDWIVDRPDEKDKEFAEKTWGSVVQDLASPREKAQALARSLLESLNPHRGIPSDQMKTTPFEQYRRAVAGLDHVWCGNLAEIFVQASNALDVPARMIEMHRIWSQGKNFELRTAEGHATTEIFDAQLNRWVWIDLTFSLLGMELEGYGPIHMAELHRSLNDPEKIKLLYGIEYDTAAKTEKRVNIPVSDKKNSLLNFFKKDQTFRYSKRKESFQ